MAKPGTMPGTGTVRAGQEKTPPILPFSTKMESAQRLHVGRRDAPNGDERFCRRIRPADDVFGMHNRQILLNMRKWSPPRRLLQGVEDRSSVQEVAMLGRLSVHIRGVPQGTSQVYLQQEYHPCAILSRRHLSAPDSQRS